VGKPPPKPPRSTRGKKAGSDLHEVERALSVLDGRDPEFIRAQRETREAAIARSAVLDTQREQARRQRAVKNVATLAVLGTLAAGGGYGRVLYTRMQTLAAGLDAVSANFNVGGFTALSSSKVFAPHALEIDAPPLSCFIAVTSASAGEMTVAHGSLSANHARSIGWCACDSEHVTVRAPPAASPTEGIRLLSVEARAIGGREGWASLSARPDAFASGGDACQEKALVGYIADRRFPPQPVDARWIESGPGALLARAGFRVVAGSGVGRRFALVEPEADLAAARCLLAVRTGVAPPDDPLLLEDAHGAIVAQGPALLWCDERGRLLTVRSSGTNVLVVAAAPSARVGGLLGGREWALRAGVKEIATWMPADGFAADAAALLRASGLQDVSTPTAHFDAHFVAVSMHSPASLIRDTLPNADGPSCEPSLETGALQAACVQIDPQPWLSGPGEKVGLAAAPVPFWMSVMADQRDPEALRAELALLALARRLTSEGFEPTMFSGVTPVGPGTISVLGLAHNDAVVAIEVRASPPWVIPYTDGPTWTLAGDPREVPLTAGARVTLTAKPSPDPTQKQSRTIVFRRSHGIDQAAEKASR
jgi:hypothetical protein